MTAVTASPLLYEARSPGDPEAESLRHGVLRFGYGEAPHELCTRGNWQGVRGVMKAIRGDAGAATRGANRIRAYYAIAN